MKKAIFAKRYLAPLILALFAFLMAGCGDDKVILKVADATGTISGKVVDASTRAPIKGAKVTLLFSGTKAEVLSVDSPDADLAGNFVFSGIPAGTHTLRIEATSYATKQQTVTLPQSNDNTRVSVDTGSIMLAKGFDLTVLVTDAGVPVANVTVVAASASGPINVTAVSGTDGSAVLHGLDLSDTYTVFSTPVYDTAGTSLKYVTSFIAGGGAYDPTNSDRTVSIALQQATRDDAIALVASNLLKDGTGTRRLTTPDGVIKLVFNFPVELSGGITASYVNDLVVSSAVDFNQTKNVATVSAALDTTKTILTITNSSPYIVNETYTLNGNVTARVNGVTQSFNLSSLGNVTIADNTAAGLSATSTFVADNYSGTWDGGTGANAPDTLTARQVYVNLPEYVYGTYRVVSTTTATTTTAVNGATQSFTSPTAVFAANQGGKDAKAVFRQALTGVIMPDSVGTGADFRQVTLFLDIHDAEGNAFTGLVTLTVQ